jgi:hypothetical protein
LLASLGILSIQIPAVYAIECAEGASCDLYLENVNTAELDGIAVRVTIDNTGSNTVLSARLVANPVANAPIGIDQFYYNNATIISSVNEAGWSTNFDGTQADGFGSLASRTNLNSAGTGGISSDIVFTLNGIVTEFPENSQGSSFVVHVRFAETCSGFVSNGISNSVTSEPTCRNPNLVPEFSETSIGILMTSLSTAIVLIFTRKGLNIKIH